MIENTGVAPMAPQPTGLSRRQKAAIIVRFLLNEGAELSLSDLPDDLQAQLTQMMGDMSYVDRQTLASVVMEFAAELESVGLSFPRGLSGALSALEGRISPLTAQRLRKEAGVRMAGDPWDRLCALSVEQLADIVARESLEVSAVLMSKLDVARAADLLGSMPGEQARRITYAISLTEAITPNAVARIGLSLATQLDDMPERAFDKEPESRVGEILNYSASTTRDDVLSGLDETDQGFASAVRRAIFTFADIPARLAPRDVPSVLRDVDQAILVTALAGAVDDTAQTSAEFLLENISGRLADQIREDIEDRGKVSTRDADTAQTQVVGAARRLADAGEIQLILPEDSEDAETD
ncbi:FliG C-terminal domain-containing protein [uncultured Shimia sp.]|uniref:flagellar motor switch protein FliG n=1 Tax=uncultured Shimia sp. TaxID=573152 RepID=UPI002637E6A6|nr:FliG C-terminal domain-containing protein [uncultured Shimia sp.]